MKTPSGLALSGGVLVPLRNQSTGKETESANKVKFGLGGFG